MNSWSSKFGWGQDEKPSMMTESQEDAAKAAILEKAMKGRQQADLMLRCTSSPLWVFERSLLTGHS